MEQSLLASAAAPHRGRALEILPEEYGIPRSPDWNYL